MLLATQEVVPPRQFLKININITGLLLWNDDEWKIGALWWAGPAAGKIAISGHG